MMKQKHTSITMYHHKHYNPYMAKYPGDLGKVIVNCSRIEPFVCVKEMATWYTKETKRLL